MRLNGNNSMPDLVRQFPDGSLENATAWSEVDLLRHTLKWAKQFEWLCYHSWTSINSPAGFTDLVLVRDGWIIFAELKSDKGKITSAQQMWLDALAEVEAATQGRVKARVWRPADFQEVLDTLR